MGIPDTVRFWLHAEGAAAAVTAALIYESAGGSWWLALPLLLLPDLSMVGFLRSPRLGSFTYNLLHNWVVGLAVIGIGVWQASDMVAIGGAILLGHVGIDRLLGYGLKHTTHFRDTHLQRA
jgi:hypothetical protein